MKFFKFSNLMPKEKVRFIYSAITFLIISILSIALVLEFVNQRWTLFFVTSLALFLILLTFVFQRRFKVIIPPEIQFAVIIFIYGSIYLGEIHDYYERFFWWDSFLHTFSGFILGIIAFGLLYIMYKNKKLIAHPGVVTFLAFCIAMTMGVLWEIFEFAMDELFVMNMQRRETGVVDTMLDFIANTIGASIACLSGYVYLKKGDMFLYNKLIKFFEEKNPSLFNRSKQD